MTKHFMRPMYVVLVAILAAQIVLAQDNRSAATAAATDKYVISAKAGGVNYVEGSVNVVRADGRSGNLSKRDEMSVGDVVSTGPDARAEILLNPGSVMRVGPNSSFQFKTTSLDDLRIRMDSGLAMFEVYASREFNVRVTTPNAKFLIIKSGIYRVDVTPDGGANVEVWNGESLLGDHTSTLLRSGFAANLKDGVATVRKLDRNDNDEFVAWSKSRGKELAKQSSKLRNQPLSNSLMSSFNQGRWGMFGSFGLWVYDPFRNGYSFLPFGSDWLSPYGYFYGSSIRNYRLPVVIYTPPVVATGGDRRGGGQTVTPVVPTRGRTAVPPFERMQGPGGVGSGRGSVFNNNNESTERRARSGSGPVYTPPSNPQATPPSPPPSAMRGKPRP